VLRSLNSQTKGRMSALLVMWPLVDQAARHRAGLLQLGKLASLAG
jgi:hypothetical protein